MRYFLELSYDGTCYHGWQIQDNAVSVQQVLNEALSKILRAEVSTVGSGRTDTGVHALVQVVHFEFDESLPENLPARLNSLLPKDMAVASCVQVTHEAHARFDATSRSYVYKIHQAKNPFLDGQSYLYTPKLDLDKMNDCSRLILDWIDFECFSKVHTDVRTFDCTISEARWEKKNDQIFFYVSANRFLRGMVRAMVGTLLLAGERKLSLSEFKNILESKDRKKAGRSVPACGLYLSEVKYPKEIYL